MDNTILELNFRIFCKTIQIPLVTEKEPIFTTGKIKSWLCCNVRKNRVAAKEKIIINNN